MIKSKERVLQDLRKSFVLAAGTVLLSGLAAFGEASHGEEYDGYIGNREQRLFPIGLYHWEREDQHLEEMSRMGINLVPCSNIEELDRVRASGMMAWMWLTPSIDAGPSDRLRQFVLKHKDHPALAVWQGPDEVVERFTDHSTLWNGDNPVFDSPFDWWKQKPEAVKYTKENLSLAIRQMRAAVDLVCAADDHAHPIWLNDTWHVDVSYMRKCAQIFDLTSFDAYPVEPGDKRPISIVGAAGDVYIQMSRGKPVWAILQGFSHNELGGAAAEHPTAHPTFHQSRFMAYDAIIHGARGVVWWGTRIAKNPAFIDSLYALTSELDAIQPFLVASQKPLPVQLVEMDPVFGADAGGKNSRYAYRDGPVGRLRLGVKASARQVGEDWVILVVNEDNFRHMGVQVSGLEDLDGQTLHLLYASDDEDVTVETGEIMTRLQPYEVKVYCTKRRYESNRRNGRDFDR